VVESVHAYGGRTYAVLDAATDDDEPDMPEALRGKRALRVL
jgi:hypothetical protein